MKFGLEMPVGFRYFGCQPPSLFCQIKYATGFEGFFCNLKSKKVRCFCGNGTNFYGDKKQFLHIENTEY